MSDRRLRIAFVYDALFPYVKGGAERRYHELARRLSQRHDVHLVSWTWWDGAPDESLNGLTLHGVGRPPALYGADGKRTVREAAAFSVRALPTLLRGRWDVIDCSATPYLPLASTWFASRLTGTRLTATWHEFWGEHWRTYLPERPVVARVAMAIESACRRLSDEVVAVSDFTARAMALPDGRVHIVPNGITMSEIDAAPLPTDPADILYVGRLIDEKRVDLLLDAAARLRQRVPGLTYSIVGSGPEAGSLQARSVGLGVADRVRFHGHLEAAETYGRIKAAKLLVLPSVREGFGMAVAEAQAAGTVPVVVRSPHSGAADLVRDGVDGVVVPPTAAALADAIAGVLADPRRLTAMGGAARASGAERDWERLTDRMEAVYAGLDSRASAGSERGLGWS
jgi:glycosyltransferase involved in cell wall biosynthesis